MRLPRAAFPADLLSRGRKRQQARIVTFHHDDAVFGREILEQILMPARPDDFKSIDRSRFADANALLAFVRRKETVSAGDLVHLHL